MNVIYVARWHDQLLNLWREQRAKSLSVLHLDFHCDLRGLLIDRGNQRAFRIWDRFSAPDPGNFLTHAVLLGHVDSVRWVHDDPGGRRHDIGTVKYESDLTALPYRLTHLLGRNSGVPISYQVIPYDSWDGLREGELLDIDWDFFASTEYPISSVEGRIEAFLARDFPVIPEETFISYSPEYSHPTEAQFRQFIDTLACIYQAQVVQLSPETALGEPSDSLGRDARSPLFRLARRTYHATNRELRRRGIY